MLRDEDKLQAEIVQYYSQIKGRCCHKMLFHVNGKAKNKIEGNRFKTLGVKSGVSDLILVTQNDVLFIELKTDNGKQSDEQKEFERQLKEFNKSYVIIRSLEQFKDLCSQQL
jgi:hypothetical protein